MFPRFTKLVFIVVVVAGMAFAALSASAAPASAPAAQAGDPERGAYIFSLNGGCGCHMGQAGFLAGGEEFSGPFGVVYSANITQDEATGIGSWSDQEIIDAIRLGKIPGGEQLFPVMPYATFSGMADQDAQDLVAFLRTADPIENAVPMRELNVPVPPFEPRQEPPAEAPAEGVARGEYIVNAIADCTGCHTPTNPDGSPDMSKFLAGQFIEGQVAPNITPDEETGIGGWTQADIATLLQTGNRPSGAPVGGLMQLVVEGGFKNMTESDAMDIAAYLKTIPAVANTVEVPTEEMQEPATPTPEAQMPEEQMPAEEQGPEQMPETGGTFDIDGLLLVSAIVALGALFLAVGRELRREPRRIRHK